MANDIMGTHDWKTEEIIAQDLLEAQLSHTMALISSALEEHPHFTDDCGDYLAAALRLSLDLQEARENGLEALIAKIKELGEPDPSTMGPDGGFRFIDSNYACDGVAPEVWEYFKQGED